MNDQEMKSLIPKLSLCGIGILILYTGGCITADTGKTDSSNLSQFKERVNESQEYYDELVNSDPENATAWCIRGMFYNNNYNQYDEALASCNHALELDPEYGLAWYLKGIIYLNMENGPEAELCFQNATRYDPSLAQYVEEKSEAVSPYGAKGYSIATG